MDIIKEPIITEKMNAESEKRKRYGFIVDKRANKIQIAKAVEDLYNVTVIKVNTMRYGGKRRSRYTRTGFVTGRTNAYKKAVVTLINEDTIDFYSNI